MLKANRVYRIYAPIYVGFCIHVGVFKYPFAEAESADGNFSRVSHGKVGQNGDYYAIIEFMLRSPIQINFQLLK